MIHNVVKTCLPLPPPLKTSSCRLRPPVNRPQSLVRGSRAPAVIEMLYLYELVMHYVTRGIIIYVGIKGDASSAYICLIFMDNLLARMRTVLSLVHF